MESGQDFRTGRGDDHGSGQFDAQGAANRACGAAQGVERDRRDSGIKKPIKLAAAGFHPRRHCDFGDALLVHRGGKLLGDDFLDGAILARSQMP